MPFSFEWLYRRLGAGYFLTFAVFDVCSAAIVCLATVGLFSLYTDMSKGEFVEILLFSEGCVLFALSYTLAKSYGLARPLIRWVKAGRPPKGAQQAWASAVGLPRDFVVRTGWQPFAMVALPVSVYFTIDLDLPWYSAPIIFAGATVAVAYSAILHFFVSEQALRPVVRSALEHLPPDFDAPPSSVPLRWKLLGALPLINVITGVIVSGLSTDGRASLNDLGVDVLVAVIVAFTVSLELTLLVTRSILSPVRDLVAATERVKAGDLSVRVPVLSGDELGTLASSFNRMMTGLTEREALRQAFGSYVDPGVAERVLAEGELLEGEEVEVSVLFVDICDFTAFAERASAREAVTFLNEFFGTVVPLIAKHGGHANKFIGDGVLGVFGTPQRARDHADRALAAACEIAEAVEREFSSRLCIGIGVNSGPVLAGTIGGGGRLEFTVIGDAVNVAARVEEMTRETGDTILLTEATRCLLSSAPADLEPRGAVPLKGKSEPVPIYAKPAGARARPRGALLPLAGEPERTAR